MPFISFIIPVYNVEEYLEQCVDSVLNQDYSDIEIILVDDGSTDNSGHMCDKYAESHNNIKVIHQKNQGLSGARNVGMDNASGQYIVFLDSDDYWRPNVLGSLVKHLRDGEPDILVFNFDYYDNEKQAYTVGSRRINNFNFNSKNLSGEEFMLTALKQEPFYQWFPWRYVIKRNFQNTFNFRFKEGIKFEDFELMYKILLKARQVLITDINVYIYRTNRIGAITNPNLIDIKRERELLCVITENIKDTKKLAISKRLKIMLCNNFANHYFDVCYGYSLLKEKQDRKILYAELQKLRGALKYSTSMKAKIIKKFGLRVFLLLIKPRYAIVRIIKPTKVYKIYLDIKHFGKKHQ